MKDVPRFGSSLQVARRDTATIQNLLPTVMTIYGRTWSEAKLLKFAYAYEQATHHRRAPATKPPLP